MTDSVRKLAKIAERLMVENRVLYESSTIVEIEEVNKNLNNIVVDLCNLLKINYSELEKEVENIVKERLNEAD